MIINAEKFISIKGFKALGNQLTEKKIKNIELKEILNYEEKKESQNHMDIEVSDDEAISGKNGESQIIIDF